MSQSLINQTIDFYSDSYRDSFSRINAIAIVGEQEAHDNFISLAQMLPEDAEELTRLGKIESRHKKSFESCGRNLKVTPDLDFAKQFFSALHQIFQQAVTENKIATCLLIQAIVIECFAIASYNNYIPVADDFAQKVTKSVVEEEYSHLNFGEIWLKANFKEVKSELESANRQVLPIIRKMLNEIEADVKIIGVNKKQLIEDFIVKYTDALREIGFNTRDILRLSSHGLI